MSDSPTNGPGDEEHEGSDPAPSNDQLFELIAAANELPAGARRAFLEEACGDNFELFREALAVVETDVPTRFLEPPMADGEGPFGGSLVGQTLGDFLLVDELGRGGMGVVYRARQTSLNRMVAVKVLQAIRLADPLSLERFQRESLAASKLNHSALVGILASGVEEQCAWFAMPLVEGHDLHGELAEQAISNGPSCLLPPFGTDDYRTAIATQLASLAEGLEHAHAQGVVHRDIKPRNILLDRTGTMSLADFGLAKVSGDASLTSTGALQGTPLYMSPEQTRALRDPIGPRSDVYSLSVVLYELLTLKRPFEGVDLQDLLNKISSGTPQRLRTLNAKIPRDLAVICEKGMAYRPADRYASAAALAADLRRFLAKESILARPLPWTKRAARWVCKHPWKTAIPAAILAVAATGTWTVHAERSRARRSKVLDPLVGLIAQSSPTTSDLAAGWLALQSPVVPDLDDPEALSILAQARAIVEQDITSRLRRIDGDILGGAAPRFDERFGDGANLEPDPFRLVNGYAHATESATLYPGHGALGQRAAFASILPRVNALIAEDIDRAEPARIVAQVMDHFTCELSAPIELGNTPLENVALAPGRYRFTAVLPDGRFAELERDLHLRPALTELTFWPRSVEGIPTPMVRIDPAARTLPSEERALGCPFPASQHLPGSFWIAKGELTNRSFLDFLAGTGHPSPSGWTHRGFQRDTLTFSGVGVPEDFDRERWLDLPAIGLNFFELRACAEWMGLRVPTHPELEFSQRGPLFHAHPPSAHGTWQALRRIKFAPLINVDGGRYRGSVEANGDYWFAVSSLRPALDPRYAVPPFGLCHPYGNVDEWTSSRVIQVAPTTPEGLTSLPTEHVCLGGSWLARSSGFDLSSHYTSTVGPHFYSLRRGLRCARSEAPFTN